MNNYAENSYILTDGKKYIRLNCRGQYEVVNDFSLADIFPKGKAISILNRSIKKSLKRTFYVARYVNGKIIPTINVDANSDEVETKTIAKWENDYSEQDKANIDRWLIRINGLCDIVAEARIREEEIEPAISKLDTIYRELDHYTEGRKVNAAKGYYLENLRHKIRNKRRALKIERQIVQAICIYLDDNNNKKLSKAISSIEDKVYAPQILKDLFEKDDLTSVKSIVEGIGA